jgi:Arc/MetJ-type ribon-helix-helix transcriptional regulator
MTERITFSCPDDLAARINEQLDYGDNRSELLRELIRRGLDDMESADEHPDYDRERVREREPAPAADDLDQRVTEIVDAVAASWGDDDRLDDRREAARRVLAYAIETDEAVGKSSEIVDKVFGECPVAGQDRETWWRKNVRPVLKEAGDYSAGRHGYVVTDL